MMRYLTLALITAVACTGPANAAVERPNIVVLVADDWGFSDVGAFGSEIATPHIDELARRGTRFSNFHTAASCSPTRSMLLTGVDNHLNGVGNLRETMPTEHLGQPGYQGSLASNVVTVASLLKQGGYRTYIAGKWNVGTEPFNLPNNRGFDHSIIQGDTGSDNWEPNKRYLPHAPKVNWFEDGREPAMPADFYTSEYFIDRMLGYLKSDAASPKPFFAYVGFQANHVPVQAPKAFIEAYKGRYDGGWDALRLARRDGAARAGVVPGGVPMSKLSTTIDWNSLSSEDRRYQARVMEVYAAMATAMDFHVGRLIDYLKASGEYDNTVFVFLSDNGPEGSDYAEAHTWLSLEYSRDYDRLGGKGAYVVPGPSWASASAAPLNTYKFYAGEGGIREPLIISGLRGGPTNQINTALTHVTDITPTLLDLAQIAPHGDHFEGRQVQPLTGHSLVPILNGRALQVRQPDEPLGYELSGSQALFKGDWKLVKNIPPLGDGQWHLYNLGQDPGETRDLQQDQPDLFRTMQADYDTWSKAHGVLPMPEGYSPVRQVMINTVYNYWWPAYGKQCIGSLVALLLAIAGGLAWRRKVRQMPHL
jgi:arylsulfatase/uncharacterized sulfatase